MGVMKVLFRCLQALLVVGLIVGGLRLLAQTPHAFTPTRFTVIDQGTAGKPDLLLIPGLSSSRAVWEAEAAKLAPNFRLHLVQVNGFAGQPAGVNAGSTELLPVLVEELHGYVAANGFHADVMGHSLGGLLGLMLAAKYPGDVNRLIVVDALPFYALLYSPQATVEGVKPQVAMIRQQMGGLTAEQWAAMQPMMAAQMAKSPEGQKAVVAGSTASDRGVVVEAMAEDLETDARPLLGSIKAPTLVLYEHDANLQLPGSKNFADTYAQTMQTSYKGLANVKLVPVEDSRHFIMYDQPAKFDAAVEAFLR